MSKIQPGAGYTFSASSSGMNLNIEQPFDDQFLQIDTNTHPFLVTNLGEDAGDYYFNVQPGTVNNLVPMIENTADLMTDDPLFSYFWNFDGAGQSWVVLKTGYDSATNEFPFSDITAVATSPSYPQVFSSATMPTTGNTDAYLLLATATQDLTTFEITVNQMVTGSIWALRVQFGTDPARYYYNRI